MAKSGSASWGGFRRGVDGCRKFRLGGVDALFKLLHLAAEVAQMVD